MIESGVVWYGVTRAFRLMYARMLALSIHHLFPRVRFFGCFLLFFFFTKPLFFCTMLAYPISELLLV